MRTSPGAFHQSGIEIRSSSADRDRILDVLNEFGPLDNESLRTKATFASATRFHAALDDLADTGITERVNGSTGWRIKGDTRTVNFDESLSTAVKRRLRQRKAQNQPHEVAVDRMWFGADL